MSLLPEFWNDTSVDVINMKMQVINSEIIDMAIDNEL